MDGYPLMWSVHVKKKKGRYVVSITVSVRDGYQSPKGYNNMGISWGRVRLVKCTVSLTRVSKTRV